MQKISLGQIFRRLAVAAAAAGLLAAAPAGAAIVAAEQGAFGGTTLIDFESVAAGTPLADQYAGQGIASFDAVVRGAQGNATVQSPLMFLVPGAVSGEHVGYVAASIEFTGGVDRVGVWLYKGNGPQYLSLLDADQNVLFSAAQNPLSTDSAFYDFVGAVSDGKDIRYVVLSNKDLSASADWDTGGLSTFYDDLVFSPIVPAAPVPEPETNALMLAGLAVLGVMLRRRRVAAGRRAA
jgi:hypothetical protein